MGEEITIEVYVRTDCVGSMCADEITVDAKEWGQMDDSQKEEYCKECAFNMFEWGYKQIDKDQKK